MFFLIGVPVDPDGPARRDHDAHLLRVAAHGRPTWCARLPRAATSDAPHAARRQRRKQLRDVRHRGRVDASARAARPRRGPRRCAERDARTAAPTTRASTSTTARAVLGAPPPVDHRSRRRRTSRWPRDDGAVAVVFNGEIYNFVELRARLEALGHRFDDALRHRGASCTATSSGATACVDELDGMFAFALWDRARARAVPRARSLRQEAARTTSTTGGALRVRLDADGAAAAPGGAARDRSRRARASTSRSSSSPRRGRSSRGIKKLPPATLLTLRRGERPRRRRSATGSCDVDGARACSRRADDAPSELARAARRGGEEAPRRRRAARRLPLGRRSTRRRWRRSAAPRAGAASRPSRSASPIRRSTRRAHARAVAAHFGTRITTRSVARTRRAARDRAAPRRRSSTSRSPTARSCRPTCSRASRAGTSRSRSAATAATSCSPAIRRTWRTGSRRCARPLRAGRCWRSPRASSQRAAGVARQLLLDFKLEEDARGPRATADGAQLRVARRVRADERRRAARRRRRRRRALLAAVARRYREAPGEHAPRARALPGRRCSTSRTRCWPRSIARRWPLARGARAAPRHRVRRVRRRAAARLEAARARPASAMLQARAWRLLAARDHRRARRRASACRSARGCAGRCKRSREDALLDGERARRDGRCSTAPRWRSCSTSTRAARSITASACGRSWCSSCGGAITSRRRRAPSRRPEMASPAKARPRVRRWELVEEGYCIRCRARIGGDPERPLCRACDGEGRLRGRTASRAGMRRRPRRTTRCAGSATSGSTPDASALAAGADGTFYGP